MRIVKNIYAIMIHFRRVFNIRSTSNFLLSAAAFLPSSRPFLRKYFKAAVVLPSDWVDVADCYQVLLNPAEMDFGELRVIIYGVMNICFCQT